MPITNQTAAIINQSKTEYINCKDFIQCENDTKTVIDRKRKTESKFNNISPLSTNFITFSNLEELSDHSVIISQFHPKMDS